MGSPYLRSGEVIVLTTHRVSADAVPYDVMLTTERIFLIDNRYARFEPRIIPLSAILSVQAARTPAHDPVITLIFRPGQEEGGRHSLNLVFSQNPNENRKPERDDWVRNLIQLSIAQHHEEVAETPRVPEVSGETGLRPTARHQVAPEKVRPLSNMGNLNPAPAPITVIPDDVESGGEIPVPASAVTLPVPEESTAPEMVPAEPVAYLTPVRGNPSLVMAPPARVIIPQIIEELLPAKTPAAPPEWQEPAPATEIDPEVLFRTIPTAGRSMTVTEERTPSSPRAPETATVPEVSAPSPAAAGQQEVPEIIKALHTGAVEPLPETELPDAAMSGTLPEPAPDSPEAGIRGIPDSQVTLNIPENMVQESVGHPATETVFRQEPAAPEAPPIRHPIPPAREIRPFRTTLTYAAVLLLVIALVAAGAMLLLPKESGQSSMPVTPAPGIVQTVTMPPETAQPVTPGPAATRITTPVQTLPAHSVPQEGVWVRVNSTAYYIGTVGNPELMQKVSGTGDNFYKILRNDHSVQVSVQKQDNSGAVLAVGIYRNGTLISTRSVTSPMGSVDLLIDPLTARAPGITDNDTLPEHAAIPAGIENY